MGCTASKEAAPAIAAVKTTNQGVEIKVPTNGSAPESVKQKLNQTTVNSDKANTSKKIPAPLVSNKVPLKDTAGEKPKTANIASANSSLSNISSSAGHTPKGSANNLAASAHSNSSPDFDFDIADGTISESERSLGDFSTGSRELKERKTKHGLNNDTPLQNRQRCSTTDSTASVEKKTMRHSTSKIFNDREDKVTDLKGRVVHIEVPFGKPIEEVYSGVQNGPVLGSGISGLVRLCVHQKTGVKYAVKCLDLGLIDSEEGLKQLKEEIYIMCQLDHPNIVRLEEVYESHNEIYLVQELCLGGELFDRLDEQPDYHYSEAQCARLVKQMLCAVRYIHSKGIVHRDLKLENFLFSNTSADSELKMIDFGLSKHFDHGEVHNEAVGTPYTVAPEVIRGSYDEKCDVWGIGVITYLLLSGDPPFGGCGGPEPLLTVRQNILKGQFKFEPEEIWASVSSQAKDFIKALLVTDPRKRPTAADAQKHPWIKDWVKRHKRKDDTGKLNPNVVNALVNFKEYSDMRKLLCEVLSFTLLPDQIVGLRTEFEKMDTDGSGEISLQALKQVLITNAGAGSLGALTEEEVEDIFHAMRVRKDEPTIQWHEFIAAGLSQCKVDDRNLKLAFDRMDSDHKNYISLEDMMDLMGHSVSEESLRSMFADTLNCNLENGNDECRITYDDFLRLMKGQAPRNFRNSPAGALQKPTMGSTGSVTTVIQNNKSPFLTKGQQSLVAATAANNAMQTVSATSSLPPTAMPMMPSLGSSNPPAVSAAPKIRDDLITKLPDHVTSTVVQGSLPAVPEASVTNLAPLQNRSHVTCLEVVQEDEDASNGSPLKLNTSAEEDGDSNDESSNQDIFVSKDESEFPKTTLASSYSEPTRPSYSSSFSVPHIHSGSFELTQDLDDIKEEEISFSGLHMQSPGTIAFEEGDELISGLENLDFKGGDTTEKNAVVLTSNVGLAIHRLSIGEEKLASGVPLTPTEQRKQINSSLHNSVGNIGEGLRSPLTPPRSGSRIVLNNSLSGSPLIGLSPLSTNLYSRRRSKSVDEGDLPPPEPRSIGLRAASSSSVESSPISLTDPRPSITNTTLVESLVKDANAPALQVNRELYRAHRRLRLSVLEASKQFEEQRVKRARRAATQANMAANQHRSRAGLVMKHGNAHVVSTEEIRAMIRQQENEFQDQVNQTIKKVGREPSGRQPKRIRKKTVSDMSGMLGS